MTIPRSSNYPARGDEFELGQCCCCASDTYARNVIMLELKAPVPGTGWGCVVCHLPADGALAVVCDNCLEQNAPILRVVDGYLPERKRMSIGGLTGKHEHNMKIHHEIDYLNEWQEE